jgi:hypothetical protein
MSYLPSWEETKPITNTQFALKRKSKSEIGSITVGLANYKGNKAEFHNHINNQPEFFVKGIKKRFQDANLLASGETYLGSFPANYISTAYTLRNLDFEIVMVNFQILCLKGNQLYVVTLETTAHAFDTVYDEFEKIIASFIYL